MPSSHWEVETSQEVDVFLAPADPQSNREGWKQTERLPTSIHPQSWKTIRGTSLKTHCRTNNEIDLTMPRRRKGGNRLKHRKRTHASGTFRQQYRPPDSGKDTVSDTENSDDDNNNDRDNEPIAKRTRVSNEADPSTVTAHDVIDATGNNQHVCNHCNESCRYPIKFHPKTLMNLVSKCWNLFGSPNRRKRKMLNKRIILWNQLTPALQINKVPWVSLSSKLYAERIITISGRICVTLLTTMKREKSSN